MSVSSLYQAATSYLPPFLKWGLRKKTIGDLPDECLASIFSLTLCPSGIPNHAPALTPLVSAECRQDPFVLGQVCRRWRTVALWASELWCSITIIHPKPCHMHRTELCMQRSGTRPIFITLRQSANPTQTEFDATLALLALFNSRADFWQSIDLHLNGQFPDIILPQLAELSRMQNCKLTRASLFLQSRLPAPLAQEWNAHATRLWDSLQSIPSITSFAWDATIVGSARLGNNINTVDIKAPISMEMLFNCLIHSAQTLQSVEIYKILLPSPHLPRVVERTICPLLTVLDITASQISDLSSLLGHITLPSLTFLRLADVDHDIRVHVAELIHRSQCTLDVFGIRISDFTEPQIMEWLNMNELKQITNLILEGPITDNILRALHRPAQHGHQPCYFPNLERLGLGKCVATIDSGLLLRMLGSRFWTPCDVGPKLLATELYYACITVQEVTAELKAYTEMINKTARGMRGLEILTV
ncbi:hypothetical protein BYT27DRAFT_7257561 [Phlegmacium glaucopus]|nr:hypothetical protein BYT27DRAFT_7257561 [Phlegmacium glaucopus]